MTRKLYATILMVVWGLLLLGVIWTGWTNPDNAPQAINVSIVVLVVAFCVGMIMLWSRRRKDQK
jgi:uncharacterized protein YhhL (DUF1145 family)